MTLIILFIAAGTFVLVALLLLRKPDSSLDIRLNSLVETLFTIKGITESIQNQMQSSLNQLRDESVSLREAHTTGFANILESTVQKQDSLRNVVQERLDQLSESNRAKLEEIRITVDEKLNSTLQTRLTESFGQVTEQLGKVQKGLGEMTTLSTGVSDLNRLFSNVKARGGFAEDQAGLILEDMLAPSQYVKNVRIRPDTSDEGGIVEYAIKFPGGSTDVLFPVDAKFPKEDWERLEEAYQRAIPDEIQLAGKAFEDSIRKEAKRISEKYIHPPITLPQAIMYLPTEGLYAEVARRPILLAFLKDKRIIVAGPTNFAAIITSFQIGFRTLAIQKKGDEVWKILSATRSEFEKFGGLMEKVEKNITTVQNTLGDINRKTRTINRTLKNVDRFENSDPEIALLSVQEPSGIQNLTFSEPENDEDMG